MTASTLIFATANPHKVEEVRSMMPAGVRLQSLADIGCTDDIPETADTLEGNAVQKAGYVFRRYGIASFADDTGLEVEALGGAPGVYSARYAGAKGSQEERAQANLARLLREMEGKSNRRARFRTVIAYIDRAGAEHLFEGIVEGSLLNAPEGHEGFGYDPLFVPDGSKLCFARMPLEEKNRISHRARAFRKFSDFIMKI